MSSPDPIFTTVRGLRLRRSFRKLEQEHGVAIDQRIKNKEEGPYVVSQLEKLVLAFKYIFELPPDNQNSFFVIGGYHGAPYRGAGWSNLTWWGGFCAHGQITFPTWHRAYLLRLENALRSAPGCSDVTIPFLDWCDEETQKSGLPDFLTSPEFPLGDGKTWIDNPLFSYKFPKGVFSPLNNRDKPHGDYTKLAGYQTCRFPYAGLVGNDTDIKASAEYNADIDAKYDTRKVLNDNVKDWLNYGFWGKDKDGKDIWITPCTAEKFRKCLDAPNYTLFSNTSSATQYNQEQLNRKEIPYTDKNIVVVPLEAPHNDMHLCVGGFNLGGSDRNPNDFSQANGDMGENDTAAMDPIFFLHHCFIDRMFWLWQLKHNQINELDISPEFEFYPGTNNVDSQGASAGQSAGDWLTLKTPLQPFTKYDGTMYTSLDVINIENQLGYTYDTGSFTDQHGHISPGPVSQFLQDHPPAQAAGAMVVKGTNRGAIPGSYAIEVRRELPDGKIVVLGVESVLSRWHTDGCANCQTHLDVTAAIPLPGLGAAQVRDEYANKKIKAYVLTRKFEEDPARRAPPAAPGREAPEPEPPETVVPDHRIEIHFPPLSAPGELIA